MAQCCTNNTITPKMIRSGQMQIGDRIQLEDIVASAPDFQVKQEAGPEPDAAPESIPVQAPMYQSVQPAPQESNRQQPQDLQQTQTQIPHRFTTPLTYQQMTPYLDQCAINTQGSQPAITLPQTPMTTQEFAETIDMTDVQSYLGFLRTQIGRYMRVEQLMGSNVMENRYGFLVGIGSNYIILQEITTGNIQVIDLFTIRLTYIYYSDPVVPPEFPR